MSPIKIAFLSLFLLVLWCGVLKAQGEGSNKKDDRQQDPASGLDTTSTRKMTSILGELEGSGKTGASKSTGNSERPAKPLNGRNSGTSKRVTKEGTHIFEDLTGRRTIEISMDDDELELVIIKQYSADQSGQLVERFPELEDYIALFPKNVKNHQIELNLTVRSVHKAKNSEELKKKDRKAYGIFKRYNKHLESDSKDR